VLVVLWALMKVVGMVDLMVDAKVEQRVNMKVG
jgi:hypothetical protein